jgi:hypothetical protein
VCTAFSFRFPGFFFGLSGSSFFEEEPTERGANGQRAMALLVRTTMVIGWLSSSLLSYLEDGLLFSFEEKKSRGWLEAR